MVSIRCLVNGLGIMMLWFRGVDFAFRRVGDSRWAVPLELVALLGLVMTMDVDVYLYH